MSKRNSFLPIFAHSGFGPKFTARGKIFAECVEDYFSGQKYKRQSNLKEQHTK